MEKSKMKPSFVYVDSAELKQIVAVSKKTGWAYCEDGTKYSKEEVDILRQGGGVSLPLHILKKEFNGTIVAAGDKV